jgi:alanine dehydrogenase
MRIRILSRDDVRKAVSMAEAIAIVKEAFIQLSAGQTIVPVRTLIDIARHEGIILYMPAYLKGSDALGVKIVSVFPGNLKVGRPTIAALIVVNDASTGEPRAILDGSYLTALRTGAASGVATQLLARPGAETVAIFGAGTQGRTQLEAVCEVRDIRRAWIYDVVPDAAEHYADEMRRHGGRVPAEIHVARSPAEATRQADIICTATTSRKPVVADADLKLGVHINGIGSFTPEMQEVEEATVRRARVVVDSWEASWAEAGDLIIPRRKGLISEADIHAELGEIAAGRKPGRESDEQITFFKAVGNAVQDVSVASFILQKAEAEGLGTTAEI